MKLSVAVSVLSSKLLKAAKATHKKIFLGHLKVGVGPTAVAEGAVSAEPVAFTTWQKKGIEHPLFKIKSTSTSHYVWSH